MELGPLARLLIWLLNRCPSISFIQLDSTQNSHSCQPPLQTDYVLDRDVLSIELRDPVFRQFYMDHLESCLAMPSFQKQ